MAGPVDNCLLSFGSSHAPNIAFQLEVAGHIDIVNTVAVPGWRIDRVSAAKMVDSIMVNQLNTLAPSAVNVQQLLDNMFFFARTE
jgi:hypothetical protein